ncbi:MAG: 16S rRNA (cytidine(1402)-2'-O)-methyltransferase, partial [Hydrogenimonas sp.]|nr:16S rRNA (cytidine(1402)-2'-O)-methyltransferase [Hydrogenimonas sp.]
MLTLLPTPIGNIEDITLRTLRVLEEAEILLCEDTRVTKKLINLLQERHGLKHKIEKFISIHSHNEERVVNSFEPSFFEKNVVYMSDAGMPCISDPGAILVEYCQKHQIPYTVLPGPSAAVTAYAASGFNEKEFLFYGFLPHKGAQRARELKRLLLEPFPVILYEAPHRIEKLFAEISAIEPQREVFAAKEITKRHERFFKDEAKELERKIRGTLAKGEWV